MTPVVREHAEALALAIEHGLADPKEAVKWACELIVEQESPSDELVELAGAVRPHPFDVVAMLRRFPGSAEPMRVFRKVLGRVRDLLRRRPNAWPEITHAFEQMALRGDVPEPLAGPCYGFDDQRLLAEQGVYGSVEQVHRELMAFLEAEADTPPSEEGRALDPELQHLMDQGFDDSSLSDADRVWNRAALMSGGSSPKDGDRALAALLIAHGMAMNGGVAHALEALSPQELAAAIVGFRFFCFSDIADLFATLGKAAQAFDGADERYWRSIPDDSAITERFRAVFTQSPELFSPL